MTTPSERLTVRCQMRRDYNDVLKKGDIVWTTRQGYDDFFMYYANDITPRTGLKPCTPISTSSHELDYMLQELNQNSELNKLISSELNKSSNPKETCKSIKGSIASTRKESNHVKN